MQKQLNIAPLSSSFMLTAMLGFLISAFYVYPQSSSWGFTFMTVFFLMFVAAMISLTYAPDLDVMDIPLGVKRRKRA